MINLNCAYVVLIIILNFCVIVSLIEKLRYFIHDYKFYVSFSLTTFKIKPIKNVSESVMSDCAVRAVIVKVNSKDVSLI